MKLTQKLSPVQLLDFVNDEGTKFWEFSLEEAQVWHSRVAALTDEQICRDHRTIQFDSDRFYIELRDIYAAALAKEVEIRQNRVRN